jgi:hypothetical protein
MVEEEVKLYLDINDNVMTLAHAKKLVSKQGIEEWKDYSAKAIKEAHGKYHTKSKKIWNYLINRNSLGKNKTMKVGLRLKTKIEGNHVTLLEADFFGPDEKWLPFSDGPIKRANEAYNSRVKKIIRGTKRSIGQ